MFSDRLVCYQPTDKQTNKKTLMQQSPSPTGFGIKPDTPDAFPSHISDQIIRTRKEDIGCLERGGQINIVRFISEKVGGGERRRWVTWDGKHIVKAFPIPYANVFPH